MKRNLKVTMSFSITQTNRDIITAIADRDGLPISQVVNKAIEVYALFDQQTRDIISNMAKEAANEPRPVYPR